MSLVVSSSNSQPVSANPTASLTEALRDFDKALSDQQRLVFKGNYARPGAADVVAFVSRVDAENKSRARKCVAPRLCSFLESTVQFTNIVDTFIQSNPAVAALVWGGVKTAILAASNHASYFDKITEMIMNIGRTSPIYQKFGDLYPGAVGLQTALSEYYATIIRLCIKVIQVSERPGILSALSPVFSPFDADFKDLLRTIEQNGKEIDIQIAFAAYKADQDEHKLAELERNENKLHRRLVSRMGEDLKAATNQMRSEKMARQIAKVKIAIQKTLCTVDHVQEWRRIKREHLAGTADWYLQGKEYSDWFASSDTSIMWCSGKFGSGKTVLLSNMIAKLFETCDVHSIIAYFFCRADNTKSLTSRMLFGSICRQLLNSRHAEMTLDELKAFLKRLDDIDTKGLIDLLLEHLPADKTCFVVMDGFDECEAGEVANIGQVLAQLSTQRQRQLRIICASRPELEASLFKYVRPRFRLSLSDELVRDDIRRYIALTIENCVTEGDLTLGDSMLKNKIIEALHTGAHGMFLWARLVIDELCACDSDAEVLIALNNLPRQLSDIYDRKMQRISAQRASSRSSRILEICCVLRRPLSILELQEALSVEEEQTYLVRNKMPSNMPRTIAACQGLVQVDEQDDRIRFLHHSVRQYLIETSQPFPTLDDLETSFGCICLTYLNFGDFERQIAARTSALTISPLDFGATAASQNRIIAKFARRRLEWSTGKSSTKFEMETRTLQSVAPLPRNHDYQSDKYHFLDYVQEYCICHLGLLHPSDNEKMWSMFCSLVAKQHMLGKVNGREFPKPEDHQSLREFALAHDHAAVARYSINECWINAVESRRLEIDLINLLVRASAMGKARLRWVLLCEILPLDVCDRFRSSLCHAEFVQMFLAAQPAATLTIQSRLGQLKHVFAQQVLADALDTGSRDMLWSLTRSGYFAPSPYQLKTLLCHCALWSDNELFIQLIEQRPSITKRTITTYNDSLLVTMLEADNPIMVNKLMFHAATLSLSKSKETLLILAIKIGSLNVIRDELRNGANPNEISAATPHSTPLRAAIQSENLEVLKILLDHGANPNLTCNDQHTPLMLACNQHNFDIALALYDGGATLHELAHETEYLLFNYAIYKDHYIIARDLMHGREFCVCKDSPAGEALIKRVIRLCKVQMLDEVLASGCPELHILSNSAEMLVLIELISQQSMSRREMFAAILQQHEFFSTNNDVMELMSTILKQRWFREDEKAKADFMQIVLKFVPQGWLYAELMI